MVPTKFCPLAAQFKALDMQWRNERSVYASFTPKIYNCPAYKEAVALGPCILPFVFESMGEFNYHWFWVMKKFTSVDAAQPLNTGRLKPLTQDWLNWGVMNDYVPKCCCPIKRTSFCHGGVVTQICLNDRPLRDGDRVWVTEEDGKMSVRRVLVTVVDCGVVGPCEVLAAGGVVTCDSQNFPSRCELVSLEGLDVDPMNVRMAWLMSDACDPVAVPASAPVLYPAS